MEKKQIRADFHIHTAHSDGLERPAQVVRLASARGLDTVAITDHDTVGGVGEAWEAARQLGVRLIAGTELTAALSGEELHLLAYFPSLSALDGVRAAGLHDFMAGVRQARRIRVTRAVEALRLRGVFIRESEVFTGDSESYGRLHLARALKNAGYVRTLNQAFTRFLRDAVPKLTVETTTVIDLVHRHGGLVVWAHPDSAQFARHIDRLAAQGIDGVESHNFRSSYHGSDLAARIRSRGLFTTGGSDWHGGPGESPLGERAVDEVLAGDFLAALERKRAA